MNKFLDFFGVSLAAFSTIPILYCSWRFWLSKFKQSKMMLIRPLILLLLMGHLVACSTTHNLHKVEKKMESQDFKSTSLRQLADSKNFYIGVAYSTSDYDSLIAKEFNSIVGENSFKPGRLLVDAENWKFDFTISDNLIKFAEANNMRARGHTLIWGKYPGFTYPLYWKKQIEESSDKEKTIENLMTRYINEVMGHFKGKIAQWDVVNEPMQGISPLVNNEKAPQSDLAKEPKKGKGLFQNPFTEAMGEAYIDLAFGIARKADPNCSLFLNEQINDYDGPSGKAFLELLERLVERKVPIDGVGIQSHNSWKRHDLDGLRRYMKSIGDLGLKVEITELDVSILLGGGENDPYTDQAKQFSDITKICLEDPNCNGITLWGITDAHNWMDNVPMLKRKKTHAPNIFDKDLNKKPAYTAIWKALKSAQ
tara:strand:- start:17619 stop:18890 length:1272 start_codon:yes stop_codon:yes gene_type:complete